MSALKVLLVDDATLAHESLKNQFASKVDKESSLLHVKSREFRSRLSKDADTFDFVLLGESIGERTAARLAKTIRQKDNATPILKLTKIAEAKVPGDMSRNGVTAMLNLAELKSPTLLWTLNSLKKLKSNK